MATFPELIKLAETYDRELPPMPELPSPPQGAEIAGWIDQTLLKPEATVHQVKQFCDDAAAYNFASVCVNPSFVPLAAGLLKDTKIKTCAVIGFPLGAAVSTTKMAETLSAISMGASEVDMVLNIGALKGEAYGQVLNDIELVAQTAHNQRIVLKVIIETALLTRYEKIMACLLCKEAGVDYVKTSTGFSTGGATVEDVELMRRVVGATMGVKASGGIRTLEDAQAMISAGASRLGTSSGIEIVRAALEEGKSNE